MKHVICKRKSMKTARAAYRANPFTAGMSDRLPEMYKWKQFGKLLGIGRFLVGTPFNDRTSVK